MAWLTRILLIGILVFAALHLLTMAVIFAAPYFAALLILLVVGKVLLGKIKNETKPTNNTD
jgi:hypothetical protein